MKNKGGPNVAKQTTNKTVKENPSIPESKKEVKGKTSAMEDNYDEDEFERDDAKNDAHKPEPLNDKKTNI